MDAQMSTLLPSLTFTMEVEVCILPICAILRLAVTTGYYMLVFFSLILKLTWFHAGNYLYATYLESLSLLQKDQRQLSVIEMLAGGLLLRIELLQRQEFVHTYVPYLENTSRSFYLPFCARDYYQMLFYVSENIVKSKRILNLAFLTSYIRS